MGKPKFDWWPSVNLIGLNVFMVISIFVADMQIIHVFYIYMKAHMEKQLSNMVDLIFEVFIWQIVLRELHALLQGRHWGSRNYCGDKILINFFTSNFENGFEYLGITKTGMRISGLIDI